MVYVVRFFLTFLTISNCSCVVLRKLEDDVTIKWHKFRQIAWFFLIILLSHYVLLKISCYYHSWWKVSTCIQYMYTISFNCTFSARPMICSKTSSVSEAVIWLGLGRGSWICVKRTSLWIVRPPYLSVGQLRRECLQHDECNTGRLVMNELRGVGRRRRCAEEMRQELGQVSCESLRIITRKTRFS